jgi:DNA-binding response OmpR family regulator
MGWVKELCSWMLGAAQAPIVKPFTVLCLTTDEENFHQLQETLRPVSIDVLLVSTCEQTIMTVRSNRSPVVVCTESFNGSDWRALLRALEDVPVPPSVIVLRSSPDPKLWADVLTAGGFDVVSQPFEFDSLLWVVMAAQRRWERKREILRAREENLSSIQRKGPQSEYSIHGGVDLESSDVSVFKH